MSASADISKLLAGFAQVKPRVVVAALKGADIAGEQVIGDAQQLCPVLTGHLQGSGTTEPAQVEGDMVTKVIGFDATYAAAVHENLDANHKVGQAKFLETAVRNDQEKVTAFIAQQMKEAL